jgi:hypothetical protein
MKTDYFKKLLDPRWQKRRLEVFERDEFRCRACGSEKKTLQVHHLYYKSGREPWDYPLGAYKTFCLDCHKEQSEEDGATWEAFCTLENEFDLASGSGTTEFISSLGTCSDRTGEPPTELLALLAMVMQEGIIDLKQIKDWRNQIRRKEKG